MLIRLLATAALVGLHVQHTEAHSWVGCTDYRGDINYYDNDACKGFPRNWAGARGGSTAKQPKGYELAADTGYNVIGKCQQPLNLAQYGGAFPMAQYEQDSVYCLAWPLKNHAAATCTNQYIPDTETSVWLWPQGTRDAPTQADVDNWRAQGRELNNNFGYHKNGEIDCLGFQRTPKFCDSTGQAMATGCFHVPADAPLGVRSFMWYWAFNSQGDDFITCFEAEIKPKGTLNNGRQLERGAPWLPDNLNSGDNLGAGGNTCKNNWATRVGARFQKFSEWKAGVSAGVIVQQGAGGQPQTPVTNPPPPVITPPPNMPPPVVIPPPTNGGGNNPPATTNPSCAPGTADKVPTQIPISGTFNIDVSYNTPAGGFLSVNILSGGGGNFGFAYLAVEPGTGTKTLMVTVFGRLVSGGDYQLLLSVRTYDMSIDQQGFSNIRVPVKAGANVVYGTIQTTPVVTPGQPPAGGGGNNGGGNIPQTPAAAVDYIDENASTFPATIAASGTQTVSVKYGARVNSVIVVDILQKDTYLWFGKGTARVTPGEGTASITINVQNNPTTGNNYMYNVYLVDSGSFDADESNAWQKASVGPKGITLTVGADNGGNNGGNQPPPPVVTPPDNTNNNPPPPNNPPPAATPNLPAGKYDYAKTASNSILFYEAQRTGRLINNRILWRGDSALNDKGVDGEDLSGGYFDAGDHVKFNFPMAYSITTLAWGILQNKNAYVKLGELKNAMDGIKWGADYLLKCHPDVNGHRLYAQVGDGDLDHSFWGRPEEMTMPRPATYIDDTKPGSDLAGETAAAFAATALVYQDTNPTYAATLIAHARTLFDFADTVRGKYSDSIKGQGAPAPYYVSNDFKDELVWASIWLFKATGDTKYLDYTKTKYMEFMIEYQKFAFSWDSKGPGVSMLVAQALKNNQNDPVYKAAIASVAAFVKDYSADGTVPRTPAGYPIRLMWGSNRFASAAAWIAMVYADSGLAGADAIPAQTMASNIINYIHGDNPNKRSYVVGQGNNPPTHYHHRAASCPNKPASCGQPQFTAGSGNPQTLFGALVGGPKDTNDNSYQDQRDDYITNEVTLDYNAAFQNAVFRLAAANIGLQSASDLENAGGLEGQDEPRSKTSSTSTIPIIIGASVGGVVLLLLIVGLAMYKKHHTSNSVTNARVGKETHV